MNIHRRLGPAADDIHRVVGGLVLQLSLQLDKSCLTSNDSIAKRVLTEMRTHPKQAQRSLGEKT